MYDDLILRLRDAAKMSEALAVLLPHSEGNATAKLYNEAADAIEETSKRVPKVPHGRLIDADALLMRINHEGMEAYMDGVCYGVHPSQEYLDLLGEIIDDAPTIIPAEEGET